MIKPTKREQFIINKVLLGLTNKKIANDLNITEKTVKGHLTSVFKKYEVKSRTELIIKLYNKKWEGK